MDAETGSTPSGPSGGRGGTSRQLLRNSISSYGRLLGTFIIGMILGPYLLRGDHMGLAGYGLFALLMSSVGIINVLQSTLRGALVRELSSSFHSGDPQAIRTGFNAALISSLMLGIGLGGVMLIGTPLALWVFQFGPRFAMQMRWSWIVLSLYTSLVVVTVPFITLFDATSRIPQRNVEMLMERVASVVAAVVVFSQQWGRDYPLLSYIAGACFFTAIVRVVAGAWAYVTCPSVSIDFRGVQRQRIRDIFSTGCHVGKGEIANNLYDRTNQLLINIFLGAVLNGLFGVVVLLIGYTNQIAMGISFGIEPMAAKFSHSAQGAKELVGGFVLAIARVQAGVIFPIIAVLFMMGQILINFWLGDRLAVQRYAANRDIAQMLMILLVGSPFFVIMQGPLRIMVGAGDVKAYSSRLLQVGVLQAIVAGLILWLVPDFVRDHERHDMFINSLHPWGAVLGPEPVIAALRMKLLAENVAMYAVAASMSTIYLVVYGVYIPLLACALYDLKVRDMYIGALLPGGIIGVGVAVFLGLYRWWIEHWNIWLLLLGVGLAGICSVALMWRFVLTGHERSRLLEAVSRRNS